MSKRAEEAQASAILPESIISYAKDHAVLSGLVYREGVKYGYEQAEKDTIRTVKTWLSEIHRVCDITDENGYRIELRNLIASLEKTLEGE